MPRPPWHNFPLHTTTLSNLHVLHTSSSLLTLALLERIFHSLLCLLAGGVAADANEGALGEGPLGHRVRKGRHADVTDCIPAQPEHLEVGERPTGTLEAVELDALGGAVGLQLLRWRIDREGFELGALYVDCFS